jgi:hypothetical protein
MEEAMEDPLREDEEEENEKHQSERFKRFKTEFHPVEEPRVIFKNLPKYRDHPGPINMPKEITPLSIFELFWSRDLMEYLTEQTNLYKYQFLSGGRVKKNSRNTTEINSPILITDLYAYLACFIMQGLNRYQSAMDHWSDKKYFKTQLSSIMSKTRFQKVNKFFHIMNNEEDDGTKLYKVKALIDLMPLWRKHFMPGRDLTLDETIIPFYGKSSMKTCNIFKPEMWGFKAFTLCDSRTSYCLEFQIYTGTNFSKKLKSKYGTNFKTAISLDMTKEFFYKNHYLCMDNYYSSWDLAKMLADRNTYMTGTINLTKKEKDYSDNLFGKAKDKDEYAYLASDYANIIRLRNTKIKKKTAYLISSVYSDIVIKEKTGREYPKAVYEYNANRSGVDNFNKLLVNYRNLHKQNKWWKTIFAEILDVCIINAYIIYKAYDNKIKHKEFRRTLVECFASLYVPPEKNRIKNRNRVILEKKEKLKKERLFKIKKEIKKEQKQEEQSEIPEFTKYSEHCTIINLDDDN